MQKGKNKRLPLPGQERYSKTLVLNSLMTFNMSGAFLINMPFNIITALMYVLCMRARGGAQTPPDAIWSILVNVRRFFGPWSGDTLLAERRTRWTCAQGRESCRARLLHHQQAKPPLNAQADETLQWQKIINEKMTDGKLCSCAPLLFHFTFKLFLLLSFLLPPGVM